MAKAKWVLPIIVFAQFCGTSVWFATNGIINELLNAYDLPSTSLGHLTSAIQFGFIIGTLIFALLAVADRFSPVKVFFICALLAAVTNWNIILSFNNMTSLLTMRFMTGIFLAGIYPVGMKIAADHFEKGLGKALGYLVGALVLGTAFPHLLKAFPGLIEWKTLISIVSILAAFGGLLMLIFVPNGPFRKQGAKIKLSAFGAIFKNKPFRSAAFGYFGHMWELYAFWAFVPVILSQYDSNHNLNIPLLSFFIIAIGSLSCVVGGYISLKFGAKQTAYIALLISGLCCLLLPLIIEQTNAILFVSFLLIWGASVVADSPLFSTLVANNAQAEVKGSALTLVNSIGFGITIFSIQLINTLHVHYPEAVWIFMFLAIGPVLGLNALYRKERNTDTL